MNANSKGGESPRLPSPRTSVASICRFVGWTAIIALLITAFTPFSNLLGELVSATPRLGRAGAIVVLGGPESEHRTVQGILLYRQGLAPLVVFSDSPSEVHIRMELAQSLGLPLEAILIESAARTTREEAVRIGALLRVRGIHKILLVTDALSMWRAEGLFRRAGFDVLPAPSTSTGGSIGPPQDQLGFTLLIAEETTARLYYWLIGYL